MQLEILATDWASESARLTAIRRQVFVEEQGVPVALELDSYDPGALHLLAVVDAQQPVGTTRLLDDGQIGRMAVLRGWRRHGIGGRLLRRAVDLAAARGQGRPFLHAQCGAIPFYERVGFEAEGPIFLDAGIAHRLMRYSGAWPSD